MTYSMNEALPKNVIGLEVAFDLQPYTRGRGKIVSCTPRVIKDVNVYDQYKGTTLVTYEVFDLEVEAIEGTHCGAFLSGVAVGKRKDITGQNISVTSVSYHQLQEAAFGVIDMKAEGFRGEKRPIVIARCG